MSTETTPRSNAAEAGAGKRDDLKHALTMIRSSLENDARRIASLLERIEEFDDETVGANNMVGMVVGPLTSMLNTSSVVGYVESALTAAARTSK